MAHKRPRSALEPGAHTAEFVSYGTALPSLDSTVRDDGSYVPLWKQEVTDERGRKRLHGAFTGGFSAGYFNTVGSKEGWTPATFRSSRTARATTKPAAPEDFMDEEDIREAEEAKVLETNQDFAGLGDAQGSSQPFDFLMPAVQNTRGYTLLRKMGWRDGCALGPKRPQNLHRDHSPTGTQDFEKASTASPQIYVPNHKGDSRGLGYSADETPQDKQNAAWDSASRSAFVPTASSTTISRKPRGCAFGVGIVNHDEDEDDAYEIRPKTVYNKTLDAERGIPRRKGRTTAKHLYISKKASNTLSSNKCHDERLPLPGFRLAATLPLQSKHWQLPSVPKEWSPINIHTLALSASDTKGSALDPHSRAKLLGETPLPGKSVFAYVSANSRNRLATLTGRFDLPPGLGEVPSSLNRSTIESTASDLVPILESHVASSALNHPSMPYADDPDKRRRYRIFLEIKAGQREGLPERKYGMHSQDWAKEMTEFVAAAHIFRPLAGSIANRFTSAVSSAEGNMSAAVSGDPDPLILTTTTATDAAGEAADMGMYGALTRTIVDFRPSHLLCKRFGVPVPPLYRESSEKLSADEYARSTSSPGPTLNMSDVGLGITDLGGTGTSISQAQEEQRAAEEVFQAIFGED